MAALIKAKRYLPEGNSFYRKNYYRFIYILMFLIVLAIAAVMVVYFQMRQRPLPVFNALQSNGQRMLLLPFDEPNLLPDTILRWASKAATTAYNFDFYNFKTQIGAARPFFTSAGWDYFSSSINGLIDNVVKNQLFVNGVVNGPPVISNQGDIPGRGYVWRVQVPFLVTYQSSNALTQRIFFVVLSIVRVPTSTNPQGIGIDQFVMVPR